MINLVGNHAKRRTKVVEFSNFSPENTPPITSATSSLTGGMMMNGNRFYNLLFECVTTVLNWRDSGKIFFRYFKTKATKTNYGEDFFRFLRTLGVAVGTFLETIHIFLKLSDLEKRFFPKTIQGGGKRRPTSSGWALMSAKQAEFGQKEFMLLVTD